jgi:uncharacterized protein YmfQ (DUF2313 family)
MVFNFTAPNLAVGPPGVVTAPRFTKLLLARDLVVGPPDGKAPNMAPDHLFAANLMVFPPEFTARTIGPLPPLPPAPIAPYTGDRHIRRSGDDYGVALANLLPTGAAWPREPDRIIMKVVSGLAEIFGFVDSRAADLLERESDPRQTIELLQDWERNWGLPDPCFAEAITVAERQKMLVMKMTLLGAQSRAWFIEVMAWIGHTISIKEWAPFMAGVSRVGDTRGEYGEIFFPGGPVPTSGDPEGGPINNRPPVSGDNYDFRWEIGPPEMRFFWSVRANLAKLQWFRAASGQAGVDPHLRIGLGTDLECLLQRWKPAHTDIVFDYSYLRLGGPLQGTP